MAINNFIAKEVLKQERASLIIGLLFYIIAYAGLSLWLNAIRANAWIWFVWFLILVQFYCYLRIFFGSYRYYKECGYKFGIPIFVILGLLGRVENWELIVIPFVAISMIIIALKNKKISSRSRALFESSSKKKILYFEDDFSIAAMFQMVLEKEGFEVKHYLNPPKIEEDLIVLVLNEKPDLIIMDIIMPEIDGYSATKILKNRVETKNIPVFGISNMNQKERAKDAISCGMADYFVTHHLTPAGFIDCIKKFFNSRATYTPNYKKYL